VNVCCAARCGGMAKDKHEKEKKASIMCRTVLYSTVILTGVSLQSPSEAAES
jgi:hypothetical protein